VLYSNSTSFVAPTISTVSGTIAGSTATFTVTTPNTNVQRGVLLFLPAGGPTPQAWQHVELINTGGGKWVGTVALPSSVTSIGQFFVQLIDNAGNVGVSSNKARNYSTTAQTSPFTFVINPGPDPNTGLYSDPTTVTINAPAGFTFTAALDGGTAQSFTGSGTITVTGDGAHTISLVGSDGSTATVAIPIDSHPPAITITTPANGSTFHRGQSVASSFSCTSQVTIVSCNGPAVVDTSTPGTHTFTVTSADVFGRTSTASTTYQVIDQPPVVTFTTTPTDPTDQTTAHFAYIVSDPDDLTSTLTVTCTLDGQPVSCGAASADLSALTPQVAAHTFSVQAKDPGGGVGTATFQWHVYFDTNLVAQAVVVNVPSYTATLRFGSTTPGAGMPLSGQTVTFFVGQTGAGGAFLCSATTDSTGTATCKAPPGSSAAKQSFKSGFSAVFAATPPYFGSTGTAGFKSS
jgi:hypothetical protein